MKKLKIAIVGASGAVGQELLKVLDERNFPLHSIKMLASSKSAGKIITFKEQEYTIEETTRDSFKELDLAFFAGGSASREFARFAQKTGVVVIDNSSTFRLDDDVPLIIPEVNGNAAFGHKGLIANPNCSTILMVGAINAIHKNFNIKKIIISTYQAVSGAGQAGLEELRTQSIQVLNDKKIEPQAFQHQIAFNLIPHIDVWENENYTKEEMKLVNETHKILNNDSIAITSTAVRVPVMRSHAASIYVETEKEISADQARKLLSDESRITLLDEPSNNIYPMPINATNSDDIFVGRIRNDLYNKHALNLWACFDQIRKGAATNAVQIAELLLENKLI